MQEPGRRIYRWAEAFTSKVARETGWHLDTGLISRQASFGILAQVLPGHVTSGKRVHLCALHFPCVYDKERNISLQGGGKD